MNADLHFHPSFFGYGDKPHITEREYPTIEQIVKTAFKKGIDVLAITSCSTYEHIDRRWENYMQSFGKDKNVQNIKVDNLSNSDKSFLYIFHGQEFKTEKADLNVLFAEKRIPVEKSNGNFCYLLDAARDSGDNVVITLPHPARENKLTPEEIRFIYDKNMIHALESYDALNTKKNNEEARVLSINLKIPGIAVSDGHRLEDLGNAYTNFFIKPENELDIPFEIKKIIEHKNFERIEHPSPLSSKILYLSKLINAKFFPNF